MIANVTLIPKKHSVTDLEFKKTNMLHFCFWQFLGPWIRFQRNSIHCKSGKYQHHQQAKAFYTLSPPIANTLPIY